LSWRSRAAQLRRQTGGVFSLQSEYYLGALEGSGVKGELGNKSHIVLYVYLQILIAEDLTSLLKNFSELSCGQSVVVVVGHPGLKTAHRVLSQRSTTIDEPFADPSDLRHVRVRGS
jgi:hypothetical protein